MGKVEAVNMLTGHRIVLISEQEVQKVNTMRRNSSQKSFTILLDVVLKDGDLIWCICDIDNVGFGVKFYVKKISIDGSQEQAQ